MAISDLDRRRFLRIGGSLSLLGAGGPLALQLAAAGAAGASTPSDYRAVVCIFLTGGNDGANTVLATDVDSWSRYFAARNTGIDPIALMPVGTRPMAAGQISPVTGRRASATTPEFWGGVLPIVPNTPQAIPPGTNATQRTFGLHPFLGPLKALFDSGRLAVVANVGALVAPVTKAQYLGGGAPLPPALFSHNDQQAFWQSGGVEGSQVGWGGAMADTLASGNGANSIFTAIAPGGGALFLAGRSVRQYVVEATGKPGNLIRATQNKILFGSSLNPSLVTQIATDTQSASAFANDYAPFVTRSAQTAALINAAVGQGAAAAIAPPPNYVNPFTLAQTTNPLALQLQTVAKLIAAGPALGLRRQIFFVKYQTFDTHFNQNGAQPDLLGQLAQAMAYFDTTLTTLGGVDVSGSVTTFTASDFGRTFTTNGSGTDHGWGSHHFVMGGAVRGGRIYGQFPTIGVDGAGFSNPDMVGNAMLPSTSVDQYGASMGSWLGVSSSDLATIFPNLGNYATPTLDFV